MNLRLFVVPDSTTRLGDWRLFSKAQKPGGGGNKGMQGRKAAKGSSLFNLKNDPGETTDLSKQYPEKVRALRQRMQSYMRQFNANIRPIGRVD